ncbi:MAG: hypothetical protein QOJ00_999, partial [Actinomycetota bacterium]
RADHAELMQGIAALTESMAAAPRRTTTRAGRERSSR